MSIEVQKQIKANATEVQDYFKDLHKWKKTMKQQEVIRDVTQRGGDCHYVRKPTQKIAIQPSGNKDLEGAEKLRRDNGSIRSFYESWDAYDPDKEIEKIEEDGGAQQYEEELVVTKKPTTISSKSSHDPPIRNSRKHKNHRLLAEEKKDEGNNFYRQMRYKEASTAYSEGLQHLERETDADNEEVLNLKVVLLSNRAMMQIKLQRYPQVVEDCTQALEIDPNFEKALFRRGYAYVRMKQWECALKDLEGMEDNVKAASELAYVRRMIEKTEAEHKMRVMHVISDPLRKPTIPMRTLPFTVGKSPMMSPPVEEKKKPAASQNFITIETVSANADAPYISKAQRMMEEARVQNMVHKPTTENYYLFEKNWTKRVSAQERVDYLRELGAAALPSIFGESLTSEILIQIAKALLESKRDDDLILEVMRILPECKRFQCTIMFLDSLEVQLFERIFENIEASELIEPSEVEILRHAFQMVV